MGSVKNATSIPAEVKKAVWERDNGRCIICGAPGNPWCHYIPRSALGLGVEQNTGYCFCQRGQKASERNEFFFL